MTSDVGLEERVASGRSESRLAARARSEYGVFLSAVGVVALHVVDDNFLQPERGTSARDHLVSGLVPLAILALTAWAYPRLRAGARAATAVTLGLLASIGGIGESAYYTVLVGPSRDDYTGPLMVLAGLILIGLGVLTLWKTRKRDTPHWWRYLRRALIAVAASVVFFELVFAAGLSYVVTHSGRPVVPPPRLGAQYEEVSFRTSDGLELLRAVQEPRGRDRLPRTQGPSATSADARPARIRRSSLRPAR